jgi:AcrR family transcriptional regulator
MESAVSPTRSRILRCGLNLVSTTGLSGITVGILAEQVGMSKSGLFARFGSREETPLGLLDYTAQFAQQHVVTPAMLAKDGLPRLRALISIGLDGQARPQGGHDQAARVALCAERISYGENS